MVSGGRSDLAVRWLELPVEESDAPAHAGQRDPLLGGERLAAEQLDAEQRSLQREGNARDEEDQHDAVGAGREAERLQEEVEADSRAQAHEATEERRAPGHLMEVGGDLVAQQQRHEGECRRFEEEVHGRAVRLLREVARNDIRAPEHEAHPEIDQPGAGSEQTRHGFPRCECFSSQYYTTIWWYMSIYPRYEKARALRRRAFPRRLRGLV